MAAGAAAAAGVPVIGVAQSAQPRAGRGHDIPKSLLVDRVVRTTCSPNCTGSCGQLAFVRDGVVVKIQQAADYPDTAYSPRGCMKGLSYLNQVYGPDRIAKPRFWNQIELPPASQRSTFFESATNGAMKRALTSGGAMSNVVDWV